uniref:Uncharacterized protein n=1 Tax=Arundo donax TaxID=35708 RepID=A0A0A9E1R9_ARUDO
MISRGLTVHLWRQQPSMPRSSSSSRKTMDRKSRRKKSRKGKPWQQDLKYGIASPRY